MLNLKSSMNKSHGLKGELSIDALTSKPTRLAPKGGEREREGYLTIWVRPGAVRAGCGKRDCRQKKLGTSFCCTLTAMTQQQTQLIDMVSSMGESSRERLEALEQKVYSIELRLCGMEQRQSLPGFPPTPAEPCEVRALPTLPSPRAFALSPPAPDISEVTRAIGQTNFNADPDSCRSPANYTSSIFWQASHRPQKHPARL
jgi:hypothetical protein